MEECDPLEIDTEFIEELLKEVMFFVEKIKCDDSQEMRRAFCRSLFQFVDGAASDVKTTIAFYESPETIGDEMYLALFDKIEIDENGKTQIVTRRKGFANNIDFAFDSYGAVAGLNIDIKENKAEWDGFKECISIRNRVVHPKSVSDLEISNNDMLKMLKMFVWLTNKLCDAHKEVGMYFLMSAEKMKKHFVAQ